MSTRFVCILVEIPARRARPVDSRALQKFIAAAEEPEASEGVDNLWNRKLGSLRLLLRENSPLYCEFRCVIETVVIRARAGVLQ